jgi:hypothetical protein
MNAVGGIFAALAIIFSGGYALKQFHREIKKGAIEHVHHGMPSLVQFTNLLTCSKIDRSGNLVRERCGRARNALPSR